MFATIRRYTPKGGSVDQKALDSFKNRIEENFAPLIQNIYGFHSYCVVNAGKDLISISIFENKAGALESTRRAAEFVKKDPLKDQMGSPEVLEGDLLVLKEATVAAH